jgi:hypothetical protein
MPLAPKKRIQGHFVREKKERTRDIKVTELHYKHGDENFVDQRKKRKKKSIQEKYNL